MQGLLQFVWTQLKRMMSCKTALFPVALLLTACSSVPLNTPTPSAPRATTTTSTSTAEPTSQQILRAVTAQQDRLSRVAAPLLVNNAALCKGNARQLIGLSAKNKYSYSTDYVDAAQSLGLDDRLQVMSVLNNSGAARVGVKRGDILATVEDQPMPQGPNAERQAAILLGPLVNTRSAIKLGLIRNGTNMTLNVPLTLACGFGIELGNTDNVNAYSDGHRVLVTRGMLNFARSDVELAYVLATELAHNALGHPAQQRMSATVGGIIDNLIRITPDASTLNGTGGVRPTPPELDAAADTLALYMLTRAGYNIDGAADFWQRLANQYPASVLNGYTAIHPATAYRLAAIQKTTADIKAKLASKKILMP